MSQNEANILKSKSEDNLNNIIDNNDVIDNQTIPKEDKGNLSTEEHHSFIEDFAGAMNVFGVQNKSEKQEENKLEELINSTSFGFQQGKMLLILFSYAFAEGFSMLSNSLVVPILEKKWNIGTFEKGFMGGSIFLGFMTGSLVVGQISDNFGRKLSFILGCLISLIGGLFGMFIKSGVEYIFTNTLIGIGIGISVPSGITLASEISNPFIRARMIGLMWVFFPTGEIVGCLVAKNYQTYDYLSQNWLTLHLTRCIGVII